MYGIDADTNELLRYSFETDDFVRIGVITTSNGQTARDNEALAWVPSGPARGMYAIPSEGPLTGWLLRVNPLDGMAVKVNQTNLRKAIGMVVYRDEDGDWMILVSDRDSDAALYAVDPMTGDKTFLLEADNEYEGLCLTPDDRVLGNTEKALWEIDLMAGTETKLGDFDYEKVESLEYAFGDGAPTIDATAAGVPAAWTANGLLLAFDDDSDALMLVNPANGDAVNYNCSFTTVDCEGLVFTTKNSDPYGRVVATPAD